MRDYKNDVTDFGAPDATYPSGKINDVATGVPGTQVGESLYGDIVQAVLKLVRDDAIVAGNPNGNPDNETNGYELFEVLVRRMQTEITGALAAQGVTSDWQPITITPYIGNNSFTSVVVRNARYKKVGRVVYATVFAQITLSNVVNIAELQTDLPNVFTDVTQFGGAANTAPVPCGSNLELFRPNSNTIFFVRKVDGANFAAGETVGFYYSGSYLENN